MSQGESVNTGMLSEGGIRPPPHPCAETMGGCGGCYGEGVCGLPPIPDDAETEAGQLAPVSRFPTPYGVEVDVYAVNVEGQMLDITPPEGTAILFGIYDAEERRRFAEDIAARMPAGDIAEVVQRYGGHRVPSVPLTLPDRLAYNAAHASIQVAAGDLGVLLTGAPWAERAVRILAAAESMAEEFAANPEPAGVFFAQLLAASLELCGEEEITCLEAAAFYALTSHDAWRDAGRRWLTQFRSTWLRDWTAARPLYCRIARAVRKANPDVPAWLCGVS